MSRKKGTEGVPFKKGDKIVLESDGTLSVEKSLQEGDSVGVRNIMVPDNPVTVRVEESSPLAVKFAHPLWCVFDDRDALLFQSESRKEATAWAEDRCKDVTVFRKDGSVRG